MYFNFSSHEKILKFDIFRGIIKKLLFSHIRQCLSFTYSAIAKYITNEACNWRWPWWSPKVNLLCPFLHFNILKMAIFVAHQLSSWSSCTMTILFYICLSTMRKYILQILRLNFYLLINYKLLKITVFPFKDTVLTFWSILFVNTAIRQEIPMLSWTVPICQQQYLVFIFIVIYISLKWGKYFISWPLKFNLPADILF